MQLDSNKPGKTRRIPNTTHRASGTCPRAHNDRPHSIVTICHSTSRHLSKSISQHRLLIAESVMAMPRVAWRIFGNMPRAHIYIFAGPLLMLRPKQKFECTIVIRIPEHSRIRRHDLGATVSCAVSAHLRRCSNAFSLAGIACPRYATRKKQLKRP